MTARGPLRKTVKTTAHYDRIAIRHGQAQFQHSIAKAVNANVLAKELSVLETHGS